MHYYLLKHKNIYKQILEFHFSSCLKHN
jgi:hypothetical protein